MGCRDGEGALADLFKGAKRSFAGDEDPVDVRGDVVDGLFAGGAVRERDADEIVHFLGVTLENANARAGPISSAPSR